MFENPRRGRQARNFKTNVPKILGLKSSSEQIFSENSRWVPVTFCGKRESGFSTLSQYFQVYYTISKLVVRIEQN